MTLQWYKTLARRIVTTFGLVILFPPVLLLWALRPLVLFRFGSFRSDRIGHFSVNTELYLCQKDLGDHPKRSVDIFFHSHMISNHQLKKMWDRNFNVWPTARLFHRIISKYPMSKNHIIRFPSDRDQNGLMAHTSNHLTFTTEEIDNARDGLASMGIGEGEPFVCFMARDSSYLKGIYPNENWEHHNYRDSLIHTYIPAAEYLTKMGYHTIRMGSSVTEQLECSNPMVIDYARECRSDLLDIYLAAHCQFFLSSDVGFVGVPAIFRRPIAWVNYAPIAKATIWNSNDLFIPKKFWSQKEDRYLKFQEILDTGVGEFSRSELYLEQGIKLIDNTPDQIVALSNEMAQRLNGTWLETSEDLYLQERYWSIFKASMSREGVLSRIGSDFLKENRELLD